MRIKKASRDFNSNDLPSNRIEVFKDCFKVRFGVIFKSGLLLLVFLLPLIIGGLIKDISILSLGYNYEGGAISKEEYVSYYYVTNNAFLLFTILASIIGALGVAGMTRVIRQVAWEEPVFFQKDFFDGIKMNGGFIVLATLILDITWAISNFVSGSEIEQSFIKALPAGALFAVILPLYLFNLSQVNVYNVKFAKATKNSIIFYIKALPRTVLFLLTIAALLLVTFISNILILYLAIVIIVVLIIPFFYLAWFLHSCRAFDEMININEYPEIVDKGIVRKSDYVRLVPNKVTKSIEELQKEIDEENKALEEENSSAQNE